MNMNLNLNLNLIVVRATINQSEVPLSTQTIPEIVGYCF